MRCLSDASMRPPDAAGTVLVLNDGKLRSGGVTPGIFAKSLAPAAADASFAALAFSPCVLFAASPAATWAANGVDFLEPVNPTMPGVAQTIVLPSPRGLWRA